MVLCPPTETVRLVDVHKQQQNKTKYLPWCSSNQRLKIKHIFYKKLSFPTVSFMPKSNAHLLETLPALGTNVLIPPGTISVVALRQNALAESFIFLIPGKIQTQQ